MKVTVVGGGSTYTPELADGLGRLGDKLPVTELVLMDPDAERLKAVGGVSQRILQAYGSPARVITTSRLEEAAAGAAAVLVQIRVGGQAARDKDETWPLACGCLGQETTGAGGLAKAMRTVPVVRSIAEQVRTVAPEAWLVNFTNPVGIVTRALLDDGHRVVGLCNAAIGLQRTIASALEVNADRVLLTHVGLNHLSWELDVQLMSPDGSSSTSVLDRLLTDHSDELTAEVDLPADLLRRLRVLPSYYLRYFYEHDSVVRENIMAPTRASAVSKIETQLLELYADPALDHKPPLLTQRGGAFYSEAAVELLAGLLGTGDGVPPQVVNVRNEHTLPFLAEDAVVETRCSVSTDGVVPLPVPPVPPLYAGLISHVSAYEHLALDAARHGGRDRVFTALLAHPLVGQIEDADGLTDLLLANNREWFPWMTT